MNVSDQIGSEMALYFHLTILAAYCEMSFVRLGLRMNTGVFANAGMIFALETMEY